MNRLPLLLLGALLLPASAALGQAAERPLTETLRDGEGRLMAEVDWTARHIVAVGRARRVAGVPRSRLERAAILDAYANLAAAARAARIDGDRRVDALVAEPRFAGYLSAYIQGAAIGPLEDDGEEWLSLRAGVPLFGAAEGGAPALGPYLYGRDDVWADETAGGTTTAVETGVLLDARGLSLAGGFAPTVRDEDGRVVWHVECAERALADQAGPIEYRTDEAPADGRREGERPLVVRVLRVTGGCDMVVSRADGARLAPRQEARAGLLFAALEPIRTITPVSPFRRVAAVTSRPGELVGGETR